MSAASKRCSIDPAAERIEQYLTEHPDAADTLAGVCHWWLGNQFAMNQVAKSLEMLVDKGIVARIKLQNRSVIYRLHKS